MSQKREKKKKNMIPRVTSSLDAKKEGNRVSSSFFFGVLMKLRER